MSSRLIPPKDGAIAATVILCLVVWLLRRCFRWLTEFLDLHYGKAAAPVAEVSRLSASCW